MHRLFRGTRCAHRRGAERTSWRDPGWTTRTSTRTTTRTASLKKGAAGWVLLAGLGVSYVISGDYAGWNFGLDEGGWGGLMIAAILMGLMYTCMVFGLAEMSSALPVAGAGYGFARRALGPIGGFATGDGGADRVRRRAGRDRHLHRRVRRGARPLRPHQRLAGLPGRLRDLHRRPPLRRRRGAQADVRHHRHRGRRAGRRRHRPRPEVLHRATSSTSPERLDDVERLPALRHQRGRGRAGLRHLVLPRGRGRAPGRGGDREPGAGHAARHHRRDAGAAGDRGADAARGPGRGRLGGGAHLGQPAAGGDPRRLREQLAARGLRELRRPGRPGRELLLDHLRLLAPAVRPVPGRLPAQGAVADQRPQHPVGGADRPGHDRVPAGRAHQGRRAC